MVLRIPATAFGLLMAVTECTAIQYGPPENISAASPKGDFRADAIVASECHRIEMRATPSERLLWSADAEGFLDELFLTDSGELLVRTQGTLGLVFYAPTGKSGARFNLGTEIPSDERVRFCGEGMAMLWEHQIWNYLLRGLWTEGKRSWIYFRTYWGRIITLDRATGALDRNPALAKRIEDSMLRETELWIASSPTTLRGPQNTFCPYLDDKVALHLFVIRAHQLKAGEPFISAARKELRGDQNMNLEDCLNRVYDPNALAKRLGGKSHLVVVGLAFAMLAGIWCFLLRGNL